MTSGYVLNDNHVKHVAPGHPEHPRRLEHIHQHLVQSDVHPRLVRVPAVPASREQLERVHTPRYIEHVLEMSYREGYLDPDTYVCDGTWDAALHAAGGTIALVREIVAGHLDNGFALVRPPGHHAERDRGMGFCIFNNVAIAARAAQSEMGIGRVLILDWDVHHGNATQHTFYDDPSVMYISIHQYPYYPGTGAVEERGAGPGEGTIVNIPLPGGVGDEDYVYILEELVAPLTRRFHPDLILVSAGYDPHWRDPLASMEVTLTGFARMTRIMRDLAEEVCDGRLAFVLEGGYDLDVLAYAVLNTFRILLGEDERVEDPIGPGPITPRPVRARIEQLRQLWGVA